MKLFFFLVIFSVFISSEVTAQTDSLTTEDSIPSGTVIIPDSVNIIAWGPWSYNPHPIQIDWSKIVISPSIYESPYTPKGAKKDIRSGKPVILFHGGFGGMPDFSSEQDRKFQRKYGVEFFSQGCMRMPNDNEEGYNQVIFDYLDKKYGVGWKYDLRYDAIGFDKPEKPVISICGISNLDSPLATYLANPKGAYAPSPNPETEISVWWYILPTSGFALLLSFFMLIKRR